METDCDGHHDNLQMYALFAQHSSLDCGFVLMIQDESTIDVTRCNFTDNNAKYGGAIFVWVSATNQLPYTFVKWIGAH